MVGDRGNDSDGDGNDNGDGGTFVGGRSRPRLSPVGWTSIRRFFVSKYRPRIPAKKSCPYTVTQVYAGGDNGDHDSDGWCDVMVMMV